MPVCFGVFFFQTHQGRVLHLADNQYSKYVVGNVSFPVFTRLLTPREHAENKKRDKVSMPCLDR